MAHLQPLSPPVCQGCGKEATAALYTRLGALVAYYCARCGRRALKGLEEGERQDERVEVVKGKRLKPVVDPPEEGDHFWRNSLT